jgi:twitching motility protein PilT
VDIFEWVAVAKSENASDLHLAAGSPPMIRVKGDLMRIDNYEPLMAEEVEAAFIQIVTHDGLEKFQKDHVNLRW